MEEGAPQIIVQSSFIIHPLRAVMSYHAIGQHVCLLNDPFQSRQ
jgi:hypothetical protein